MTTFQSQINILATSTYTINQKIKQLNEQQLSFRYEYDETIIKSDCKTTTIKHLGYRAYDAIVVMKDEKAYLFGYDGKYHDLTKNYKECDCDECYLKFNCILDVMEVNTNGNDITINIKKIELIEKILDTITVRNVDKTYNITNDELYFNDNTINQGIILNLKNVNKHILVVYSERAKQKKKQDQGQQYCSIQITKLIELNDDLAKKI